MEVTMDHTTVPLEHPYAAARHEWDERYGGLLTRIRNWRIAALLASLTAAQTTVTADQKTFQADLKTYLTDLKTKPLP